MAAGRGWRTALSVVAWLTILESAAGILLGLFSLMTAPRLLGQVESYSRMGLFEHAALGGLERLARSITLLVWLQVGASALCLAGGVGILMRRRWGWFITVLLNLAGVLGCLLYVPDALLPLLSLFDPARAVGTSWLIAALLALVPASMFVFLLLEPVVAQFGPSEPAEGSGTKP